MPVITIARQIGAGGKTMGTVIAEKLGYTLIQPDCKHHLPVGDK